MSHMQPTSVDCDLAARAAVYRLVSRLWRSEVDVELLRELTNGDLRDAYLAAGGVLPVINDEQAAIDELAVDYCQLFVGPSGHLPPCQSVWGDGQFQSYAATSMENFLDILGYRSANLPSIIVDHLAVQLDVMGQVVHQLAAASERSRLDENSSSDFEALSDLARSFFNNHLTWPTRLLRLARKQAQTDFYRAMTRLTSDFLDEERVQWTNELAVIR